MSYLDRWWNNVVVDTRRLIVALLASLAAASEVPASTQSLSGLVWLAIMTIAAGLVAWVALPLAPRTLKKITSI
ncbi:hypothetical protein Rhe02_03300 [Rhizocola hellebori]|uniref:Uncharacterized protein n=1 Tax=Rhizocola hellebori TaxID=1392758 RepID=A0A8J3VDI2_9ACTN|nr:hypothetical protein [Rhizocola hellebori]GIH02263.1 hypothetical protein Rhe02_03300 [Rhizocola hellebori]